MSPGPDGALISAGMLFLLGAFHGINPGMGWLFAVALAMQENRRAAVWRALLPLGVGHAAAIAVVVLAAVVAGTLVPIATLRWPIAGALVALGVRQLVRHRHPRWGSMRIGMAGLTAWSFLMATAHGAGLMVLPVWLGTGTSVANAAARVSSHAAHSDHLAAGATLSSALTATAIHGAGYLIVTALVAWVVFTIAGVGLLRKAWINFDLIWAIALIVTGVVALGAL